MRILKIYVGWNNMQQIKESVSNLKWKLENMTNWKKMVNNRIKHVYIYFLWSNAKLKQ